MLRVNGRRSQQSPLTRGAWIETAPGYPVESIALASPLTRGAWIETLIQAIMPLIEAGRPSHEGRGLKLGKGVGAAKGISVAPHTRGVD